MDFPAREPGIALADDAFDRAAKGLADSLLQGLGHGVAEALADPIVQALMTADGVDRNGLAALIRRMAAKLADRAAIAGRH